MLEIPPPHSCLCFLQSLGRRGEMAAGRRLGVDCTRDRDGKWGPNSPTRWPRWPWAHNFHIGYFTFRILARMMQCGVKGCPSMSSRMTVLLSFWMFVSSSSRRQASRKPRLSSSDNDCSRFLWCCVWCCWPWRPPPSFRFFVWWRVNGGRRWKFSRKN